MIAADVPGGDDDGLGPELEAADGIPVRGRSATSGVRLEHGPMHAAHLVAVEDQAVDLVPEGEAHQT